MKLCKKTYRPIPGNIYTPSLIEGRLGDFAEKGLFLLSFHGPLAAFERGIPQKVAYHLEPVPDKAIFYSNEQTPPPQEMTELFQEYGWEYVTLLQNIFYVFRSQADSPAKPHTDPVVQGMALEKLYRKMVFRACAALFLASAILGIPFLLCMPSKIAYFIQSPLRIPLYFLLLFGIITGESLWHLRKLKKIKKSLSLGIPLEACGDFRKKRLLHYVGLPVIVLLLLPSVGSFFTPQKALPMAKISSPLPYLPLSEITGAPTEHFSDVFYESSYLAPVQYRISERQEDTSFYIQYVQAKNERLASAALHSLAQKGLYEPASYIGGSKLLPQKAMPTDAKLFDEALFYQEGNYALLLLRKGPALLKIRWEGREDLSVHLEEFSSLLEKTYTAPILKTS